MHTSYINKASTDRPIQSLRLHNHEITRNISRGRRFSIDSWKHTEGDEAGALKRSPDNPNTPQKRPRLFENQNIY